jgi:hypothetical protein
MAYDPKKDYEEYTSGAQDFAHARLAKKLVDQKRQAKMGGGMPMGPGPEGMGDAAGADEALMANGDEEASESVVDEMSESPAEQSLEAAAGTEMHEKIPMELTPEEAAQIQAMRAGKMA